MKKAEEILREYIEFDDVNGSETVELLPLTIIDIMEEYASQFRKHDVSGRSEQLPNYAKKGDYGAAIVTGKQIGRAHV